MAEDQTIQCAWNGCSETFVWKKTDQEFYARQGFKPPRFCKTHRAEAKKKREEKAQQTPPASDRYKGSNDRQTLGLE